MVAASVRDELADACAPGNSDPEDAEIDEQAPARRAESRCAHGNRGRGADRESGAVRCYRSRRGTGIAERDRDDSGGDVFRRLVLAAMPVLGARITLGRGEHAVAAGCGETGFGVQPGRGDQAQQREDEEPRQPRSHPSTHSRDRTSAEGVRAAADE
ncbi:hypothetical protein GCM10009754_42340 [Amycolatopsis minnesotensis]|uniref:Uncharacterized protein n=1 Tax=Amycolatopsis minnesotensis TaxID=337894 RepID=A0ABN2R9T8_9PSEU